MTNLNYTKNLLVALEYMSTLGFNAPALYPGKFARFNRNGHRNAYAKPLEDGCVIFGDWKTGEKHIFKPDTSGLSDEDADRIRRESEKLRKKRLREEKAQQERARLTAIGLWQQAAPLPPDHPYLVRKRINPPECARHLARFQGLTNCTIIPIYGAMDRKLQSLQAIDADGSKLFLKGGKMDLGCCEINRPETPDGFVFCEGVATAQTLSDHYFPESVVVACFSANGLVKVAKAYRGLYPKTPFIIACDNDVSSPGNVGLTKGKEAAALTKAELLEPIFKPGERGSDWNDFWINQQDWLESVAERHLYDEPGVNDDY